LEKPSHQNIYSLEVIIDKILAKFDLVSEFQKLSKGGNEMISVKKWLTILSLLAVFALISTACTPEVVEIEKTVEVEVEKLVEVEITPTPTGPTGTLVRALTTFPNSLDYVQSSEKQAETTAIQLYDSLVWFDDDGILVPALAEKWEVSEDGTEYIFHLRQDVTFHNGEPFNADAVVFSWERGSTSDFTGARSWNLASSVEAIDEYTVKVTTEEVDALLLSTMADTWMMIPPGYFAEVGQEGFDEHPMGTGPFMFVEWVKGDHITMVANPDYWDGAPKIETLIFRPIPESSTRLAAIQTGEVDVVTRMSAEEAMSLLGVEGLKVIKYPGTRVYYNAFNNLTTGLDQPTMDAKVRQAMNYAVDVDAIIDALFDGFAKPAIGLVNTSDLGYDNAEPFGYDPEKALELLTEAGYPNGFSIDMACPAGAYTHFEEVCTAIAGYLGDVGIDVTLDIMESGHFWDLEAGKELPPIFGDSWSSVGGESLHRLQGALGGWDAGWSCWSDEKIDLLLDEIKTTTDQAVRATLYGELQVYMRENPPFIYLYEPFNFEVINTRVQDYQPRSSEMYFFHETWVIEE
jgi:peptide/nickel transport system substrate-binding protein